VFDMDVHDVRPSVAPQQQFLNPATPKRAVRLHFASRSFLLYADADLRCRTILHRLLNGEPPFVEYDGVRLLALE